MGTPTEQTPHRVISDNDVMISPFSTPPTVDKKSPSIKHVSTAPAFHSPLRHHSRVHSNPRRHIKETLNARSEYSNSQDDGTAEHHINQYCIKDEIGRGSFGSVHLATDQYGNKYAVKEFSKSRLRKRQQSNLLRRPNRVRNNLSAGAGFNSPLHRHASDKGSKSNSLDLIREEIAVMKKLNHPNLVSLYEVLDDPEEDSLYMVMELCQKGVVMKVGLDESADPYDEEQCRLWFRDLILGIEYLHAQGIIHRDIKPDNCLITADDVLKIVDFGVSEMFEKNSEMTTSKSAGSPAFMPPELCVARHGQVSGRAADIWSMGVTLFCLRYGRIPFEKGGMLELYEAIQSEECQLGGCSDEFRDLMVRLLEKDPAKRIMMDELREHPWVTRNGTDPLLSREENIAEIIEEPTQEELNNAITGNMGHLVVVMKAVNKFKSLLFRKRPDLMTGLFSGGRIVAPPQTITRTQSSTLENRRKTPGALAPDGVHPDSPAPFGSTSVGLASAPPSVKPTTWADRLKQKLVRAADATPPERPAMKSPSPTGILGTHESGRGQAHDPLEDTLYLGVGSSADDAPSVDGDDSAGWMVSESPGAVEGNVYEKAYQEEIERILAKRGDMEGEVEADEEVHRPKVYLTRRVEGVRAIREKVGDHVKPVASGGLSILVQQAKKMADVGDKMGEKVTDAGERTMDVGEKIGVMAASVKAKMAETGYDSAEKEKAKMPASESGQ
ncbi:Pkinase-domain-containing protein [Trichodelitschia bisporula]|uniref:Pkinase-domain-containing protein n=1 Tax=Trichodelitschia bisporula TaxID=703511 RepID=A0A6G1I8L1_9PEZI|nr:Pkinase-domain-containing protein [Trichodelitschia bisporula]